MSDVYPIRPVPEHDKRFTVGLLAHVEDVLERHGYPKPTRGEEHLALQMALYNFLYVGSKRAEPPEAAR